jgi:hypothetical protein
MIGVLAQILPNSQIVVALLLNNEETGRPLVLGAFSAESI